jgi:hypothetical protein
MGITPLCTLLYVSESILYMPDDERVVAEILKTARGRNRFLGITGALVFTHRHFVQFIEGSEAGIADLMASIRRDPRHRSISIVGSGTASNRRFTGWDMAYAGPSVFVARKVAELLQQASEEELMARGEQMISLMTEMGSLQDQFHYRKVA